MKNINKFSILVSNTIRSRIYLRELVKSNLFPEEIIYLDNNSNKNRLNFNKKISLINIYKINSKTINNKKVSNIILKLKTKNIIFSSYGSDIIRDEKILKNKNFIHCHPGKLPYFRGSAVYYYSLIEQKKIFYTTFILNKKIDDGKIIKIKEFKDFENNKINEYSDSFQRINNIIFIIKKNCINNKIKSYKKKNKIKANMYYIPHPIIRYLATRFIKNER